MDKGNSKGRCNIDNLNRQRQMMHEMAAADSRRRQIEQLSMVCALAAQHPPVHTTTAAVLMTLRLFKEAGFDTLIRVVGCSNDTLRQQLSSLSKKSGLITIQTAQGSRRRVYSLTQEGHDLLDQVHEDSVRYMHHNDAIEKRNG